MSQREVLLAKPRGFCAGVTRAIEIVDLALELFDAPIYVLHEIVHNPHVVSDFEAHGVVFVEALAAIPPGSVVIFSAHGVAQAIIDEAAARGLVTIDATCPLVTKVHLEVVRHARAGREVVMVGHREHPEVTGTLGRYDRRFGGDAYLVETVSDVDRLTVRHPDELAVVTQTTLSVDDARRVIEALVHRFPRLRLPRKGDICYATQNRQTAVMRMAGRIGLLIVVGGRNSSNTTRLRELGAQIGVPSHLVQEADEIEASWLRPDIHVGLTAGASTPDAQIGEVLARLAVFGWTRVRELPGENEPVMFRLPTELTNRATARTARMAEPRSPFRDLSPREREWAVRPGTPFRN